MSGVLVLNLDDLPAVVRAAMLAHEMRTLGRVTLRTLDGRHRVEFPICRATAARLAARSFPFEVRHCSRSPFNIAQHFTLCPPFRTAFVTTQRNRYCTPPPKLRGRVP